MLFFSRFPARDTSYMDSIPGWRPDLFKFTGFRPVDALDMRLQAQIVWTGVATFRTGRKERIYYCEGIRVPRNADESEVREALRLMVGRALVTLGASEHGWLLKWVRRNVRPVSAVQWEHWDYSSSATDGRDGVLPRGKGRVL